jgi:hypothetical protein
MHPIKPDLTTVNPRGRNLLRAGRLPGGYPAVNPIPVLARLRSDAADFYSRPHVTTTVLCTHCHVLLPFRTCCRSMLLIRLLAPKSN